MLIIAFSKYSLFTTGAHWKVILIKKYSAKIKYIKGKKNTATDTLNQLDYIPTKSDNSNTIKYIFSLMQHKTELISSSINLISTAQDKNDKLMKRILQKNKWTYKKYTINNIDILLENSKVFNELMKNRLLII